MKHKLLGCVSAAAIASLAFSVPAMAQDQRDSASRDSHAQCICPQDSSATGMTETDRSRRDAASNGDLSFRELAEIIRAPDVADEDYEDLDSGADSGERDRSSTGSTRLGGADVDRGNRRDGSGEANAEQSGIITQGEVVPEGIREVQDDEEWDIELPDDAVDSRSRDGEARRTWSPDETNPFHRGKLNPDRSGDDTSAMSRAARDRSTADKAGRERNGTRDNAAAASERDGDDVSQAREQRRDMHRQARGERRDRTVRMGLEAARRAYPDADFKRYRFDVEDGRRVVQIVGTHPDTNRRIQIDVGTDGKVREIAERVALDSVPQSVRRAVRSEIGPMRVAHASRTIDRNLDLHYEFAGYSRTGRPVTVEIRADGRNLRIDYGAAAGMGG